MLRLRGLSAGPGLLAVFLVIVVSGCGPKTLDLTLTPGGMPPSADPSIPAVLGVDAFVDLRPRASSSDARKWLGFIPGVLWIDMVSEVPDDYTAFTDYNAGNFVRLFPRALFESFRDAKLFEDVRFLPEDPYARVTYRLEGVLRRTRLEETGYYYGSSLYAWITRILGLPFVSYKVSVDADLRLRRLSDGKVIWEYRLRDSVEDKFYTVYSLSRGRNGKNVLSWNFARIIGAHLPDIMTSIRDSQG